MVSKNTKKKYEYIRTPFAVLVQGKTRQTNLSWSRYKADDERKQLQRVCITNLPQWFTKVLSGASMSTGNRQLRPRKIFSLSTMLSMKKKGFEAKGSTKQMPPTRASWNRRYWKDVVVKCNRPSISSLSSTFGMVEQCHALRYERI